MLPVLSSPVRLSRQAIVCTVSSLWRQYGRQLKPKFHLARAHAFWLCRASRTAHLDSLDTTNSTGATCNLVMITVIHVLFNLSYSLIYWSIHLFNLFHLAEQPGFVCVRKNKNTCKTTDMRIVFFHSNRISNRIGRPIHFRIESSNRISRIYHASRNTAWRSAGVPYRPIICWRLALWTNERDVRNWVLVHFNSVLKRVKQRRCTLI